MVKAFRRPKSSVESERFRLRGLDPAARYTVTNMDVPGTAEMTGWEIMEKGLLVILKEQPASALIVYKRIK